MERICDFISRFEIGDWIALLGVLLTGLFSFLLWKTTRKIGKRQNELQEKQNKIALNQTYRSLYSFFSKIDSVCLLYFCYLESGILSIVEEKERSKFQFSIRKLANAEEEFRNVKIDIELRLSEYPKLTDYIQDLLWTMEYVNSKIKDLQMPMNYDTNSEIHDMTLKMVDTIKKKVGENSLIQHVEIDAITNSEYKKIVLEIGKIMDELSWKMDDFANCTDDDIIKHIVNMLSLINDNLSIDKECKQMVLLRDKIFKEYKIIEVVKNKCVS